MNKVLKTILCICLIFSVVFTGCNTKGDSKQEDGDKKQTVKQSDKKKGEKTEEKSLYTEAGNYPIVNEPITLKFLTVNVPQVTDFATNDFTKHMEELTNIHIEWSFAPAENTAEKVNLVLASGTYPDVFYGLDISDNMEAQYGVEQSVFTPLNEYIDTVMPNFKANVYDKYDSVKGRITAVDGKIYALPEWNDCYHCNYSLKYWINQHWLDKLNLEVPTTTEEFYNVLKAFKEQDPNGNGKQDEVPTTASDTWNGRLIPFLMNAFALDSVNSTKTIVNDGKVETIANTDEYKEGLKYIKRLYDEGLIYEGSFVQKQDQLKQIATNPDAEILGGFPAGFSGLIIDAKANPERYKHFISIPPLEGPEGAKQTTVFEGGVYTGKFLVSTTCQYPEAAVRWADYIYTTEGSYKRSGVEKGRDYEDAKDGDIGIDGKPALTRIITPYSTDPQNKGYFNVGIEYAPAEMRLGVAVDSKITKFDAEGLEILLYQETNRNYEPYAPKGKMALPSIKLTAQESEEIQVIKVELEKYIEESRLKFLLGEWDLENDWDNYVNALDSIGIDKYLEVYQTGYDRQYK